MQQREVSRIVDGGKKFQRWMQGREAIAGFERFLACSHACAAARVGAGSYQKWHNTLFDKSKAGNWELVDEDGKLGDKTRAQLIIDKCAHPDYRPILQEYLDLATRDCLARKAGHEPQLLDRVFKMQVNLAQKGTMKIESWDI